MRGGVGGEGRKGGRQEGRKGGREEGRKGGEEILSNYSIILTRKANINKKRHMPLQLSSTCLLYSSALVKGTFLIYIVNVLLPRHSFSLPSTTFHHFSSLFIHYCSRMSKVREMAAALRSPTVLTILLITGCYLVYGM